MTARSLRFNFIFLIFIISLAGCGGGSSGNSVSSSSTVPQNAPPVPQPVYSGLRTAAPINSTDAVEIAYSAVDGLEEILVSAPSPYAPTGAANVVNQSIAGPVAGSALLQGRFATDGTGWLVETLSNYVYSVQQGATTQDVIEDGKVIVYYRNSSSGSGVDNTVGYSQLKLSVGPSSVVLNGSITTQTASGTASCISHTGDISILDVRQSSTFKIGPLELTQDCTTSAPLYSVKGRIYESRLGYVQFSSVKPLDYSMLGNGVGPASGGPLQISGSTSTTAYMEFINNLIASIGLDTAGSGNIDRAARFNWQTLNVDETPGTHDHGSAPLANVTQQTIAYVGRPLTLDGRYSHSPIGAFVTFKWGVELTPSGSLVSTTNLSHAHSATPTFTPDAAGDYLVSLEVSDGVQVGKTYYAVRAIAGPIPSGGAVAWLGPNAGTDEEGSIGETIVLDGSASTLLNPTAAYTWNLQTPPGSHAVLAFASKDTNLNQQPTFVPDMPGLYTATYGALGQFTPEGLPEGSSVVISVGSKIHFAPPIMIAPGGVSAFSAASADFNGDGRADVAFEGDQGVEAILTAATGGSGGVTSVLSTAQALAVGDFTLAASPELLTQSASCSSGTLTIYGYAAASFQPATTLAYSVPGCTNPELGGNSIGVAAVSMPGGGAPVVVTGDANDFVTFEPAGGGAYSPPTYSAYSLTGIGGASPTWPVSIGSGFLTGSGFPDIVMLALTVVPPNSAATPVLAVYPGTGAGNYSNGPSLVYPLDGVYSSYAIGNVSADGLTDLVVTNTDDFNDILAVFRRTSGGSLSGSPSLLATAPWVFSPVIADIDGDGRGDIVVFHSAIEVQNGGGYTVPELGIYAQRLDGSLSSEMLYPLTMPLPYDSLSLRSTQVVVCDVNGDGIEDIMILNFGGMAYVMLGEPPY